ncbi:MAG TPA: ion channel [Pyrinomonadaceae bacterium]|nr:ion channel [Pyrinomonadaceae bacterium]
MFRELLIALSIVALCVVIHTAGLVLFGQFLIDRFPKLDRPATMTRQILALILVFAVVLALHLTEAALWGVFYYARGLFQDFETSLYFSLVTYGTIGFGDVVLPQRWRLLSGIEGISGVLLCGLSGAFIFAVINALFKRRMQYRNSPVKTYSSAEAATD